MRIARIVAIAAGVLVVVGRPIGLVVVPGGAIADQPDHADPCVLEHGDGLAVRVEQRRRPAGTVAEVEGKAREAVKQAADATAKAGAMLSFWTFMSLLFGGAAATLAGMLGGQLRDAGGRADSRMTAEIS